MDSCIYLEGWTGEAGLCGLEKGVILIVCDFYDFYD